MKKQKQTTIKPSEMTEIISNHKMKEVSPPQETNKNMLDGKTPMTMKQATATWFAAAKSQYPSRGFLEVPSEELKPKAAFDREMLYEGKKNKE